MGGAGRDQQVKSESPADRAISSVKGWAVLSQERRDRVGRVLQAQVVGFCPKQRHRLRGGERRNLPPLQIDYLQEWEKRRVCRPVNSQVYTASGEDREMEKSALDMHEKTTWEAGGDRDVCSPGLMS